VVEENIQIILC